MESHSTDDAFNVTTRALSDLASEIDYLGFEPLVDGLHALLDEPRTELPLTIAVTGPWGSGKSSLMRQLQTRLETAEGRRRWRVIEFDAWKHEKGDRLWAALTKAMYEQPQRGRSWRSRFLFRTRLEATRQGWTQFLTRSLGPPALIAAGISVIVVHHFQNAPWSATGIVLTIVGALSALSSRRELWALVSDSFQHAIDSYAVKRRFERELGFTAEADQDIEALTTFLTHREETALAIFVDDLDRCSTGHIVEVVEAINQIFNSSRSRACVFVLGMDVDVVAASITAAYAETVRQLRGGEGSERARHFGLSYLAKIVQLTVAVPTAREEQMQDLLQRLTTDLAATPAPDERLIEQFEAELGHDREQAPAQIAAHAQVLRDAITSDAERDALAEAERRRREQALLDSPLVGEAEREVVRFLEPNPRRLKQFDNAYRLQLYVANRTPVDDLRFDLDQLVALAKWIALRISWPELARELDTDPELLGRLEAAFNDPQSRETDPVLAHDEAEARWLSDARLRSLLTDSNPRRRLEQLPLRSFLHVL